MAGIGLSKPYFAIYSQNGGKVSYANGAIVGKAVSMDMSLDGGDTNILYADNGAAESANSFGGGTLTLGTDDLLPAPMVAMLGASEEAISNAAVKTEGAKWIKFDDDQETPYVGFGAIAKKQVNNQTKWVAIIYPKIQFQNLGDSFTTQGETIEWQTPEITATLMRDDTEKHEWRRMSSPLDAEAEAEALIKSFLSIV